MRAILFLLVLGLLPNGGVGATKPKTAVSKTAPRVEPAAVETGKNIVPTTDPTALPSAPDTKGTAEKGESLQRTIESGARDAVPIVLDPPPLNVPFKDVVGFARPGQTERVLTGPVEHMPGNEILGLAILNPRQALAPIPIRLPSPPFVRMEIPPGLETSQGTFTVMDQSSRVIYEKVSSPLPRDLAVWDGYRDEEMVLQAGVAYTPSLTLTDAKGNTQRYFGEPIQLDALQFDQRGVRHVELGNAALFEPSSAELTPSAEPLMRAVLNLLRVNVGTRFRVKVVEDEQGRSLADKRVETLQRFLEDALVLGSDQFEFAVGPLSHRGRVTQILFTPRGEARP